MGYNCNMSETQKNNSVSSEVSPTKDVTPLVVEIDEKNYANSKPTLLIFWDNIVS